MKAHVLDGDTVVNSIIVNSLDDLPNLIDGTVGGIGWKIVDGVLTEPEVTISDDKKSANARAYRNSLLAETDWTASSDLKMSNEMKAYRQALRDVPAQEGFPEVTWPEFTGEPLAPAEEETTEEETTEEETTEEETTEKTTEESE